MQKQDTLGEFPEAFFLQHVFQFYQQRYVIHRVDVLALWKIINEYDAVLTPPPTKIEARNFLANFSFWNFFGGVYCHATTPLNVALSPDHNEITRFLQWSPIAAGNHFNRAEEIPKFAQNNGTVELYVPRSVIWELTYLRPSACPNIRD